MGAIANYAENKVLDAIFNHVPLDVVQAYMKLHIGDPGENGTANPAVETLRIPVMCSPAINGVVTNDVDIIFLSVAADETYTHASIWDHPTAGNCHFVGPLGSPKSILMGDTFTIKAGEMLAALD